MLRWREELIFAETDLQCSRRFFEFQVKRWGGYRDRSEKEGKPGHRAYAAKQVATWSALGHRAQIAIDDVSKEFVKLDLSKPQYC